MEKEKSSKSNLTEGSILDKLLFIAIPIMGTQVIQMAYNMTDMFWLGRLGSNAVAAAGTAGMFLWLSMTFNMFGRMGAEIGVSQNLGRNDVETAKEYGQSSLTISLILGILFTLFLIVFRNQLVGFFDIQEEEVVAMTVEYLVYVSLGIPFSFVSGAAMGIANGSGNSRLPFFISIIGLVINVVLDPYLIFNMNMGVAGAAIATVLAQSVVCVIALWALKKHSSRPFDNFKLFKISNRAVIKQIFVWATPIAVESFLFTFLSMFISRFIAVFGAGAMASQRIGSQIESLSWLIAGGFSSALTAYIGQNFGALKWPRIHQGFKISMGIMSVWGIIVTIVLYFLGGTIFALFLPGEPEVIEMGANYLRILAVCQFVSCLEGISSGAFRGMGKTTIPSVVSATSNFGRVIAAYFLHKTSMGLDGIWWAVAIGAFVRGAWMFAWYMISSGKLPKVEGALEEV